MSQGHIEHLDYSDIDNTLKIAFKGGTVCIFHPVNSETYVDLIRADCLARAVHKLIRSGTVVGVNKGH